MDDKILATELERLIDATSLTRVLDMLSNVCGDKAQHIETNWQDKALANLWDRMSGRLDTVRSVAYRYGLR